MMIENMKWYIRLMKKEREREKEKIKKSEIIFGSFYFVILKNLI